MVAVSALGRTCMFLVAAFLLASVAGQDTSVNQWVDQGALDLNVKIGAITPLGRLGLVPATTSPGGPSSVLAVDLDLLQPAKLISGGQIDVDASEIVTSIVAPEPFAGVAYFVLKVGSSSSIAKYNITSYITTSIQTRQNNSEIVDPVTLNITVIEYGDYNVSVVEIVPSLQKIPNNKVSNLPVIHSGVWDNVHNQGYFVSIAAPTPAICRLAANTSLLGCTDLTNVGAPLKLHVDPVANYAYLATVTGRLVRVSLATSDFNAASFEVSVLSYPGVSILSAVFETNVTKMVYFGTNTSMVVRFDLTAWSAQTNYTLSIPRFSSTRAGDADRHYGYIYFVSFSNPPLVVRINALTGELVDTHTAFGTYSRATQLSFTPNNGRDMYITDFSNFIKVSAPAPCPGFCAAEKNGVCQFGGECACYAGWQDFDCQSLVCVTSVPDNLPTQAAAQCGAVGACNNGTCECYPGYTGSDCATFLCPLGCSARGACDNSTHECTCDRGFVGVGCEVVLSYLPCPQAINCDECSLNPGCVWCESSQTCLSGSIQGPEETYCSDFHYQYCPNYGYYIVPAILTAIWGLMLLNDFIAGAREDFTAEAAPAAKSQAARESWWRTVRSANTWGMLETFQYVALFAALGATGVPTYFLSYCRIYLWSLVGVRNIFNAAEPLIFDAVATGAKRDILSWTQMAHYYGTSPAMIVIGATIIFAIIIVAMLLIRLILHFVGKPVLVDRWVYVLFRVLLFFQIPLTASGAAAITSAIQTNTDWIGLVFGFIFVVGYLAASIYALIYFSRLNPKLVFLPVYRRRLAALVAPFHYKKLWFTGVQLLKKTIIGAIFGFLASSATSDAAPGVGIGVVVLYLVSLLIFKVYMEWTSIIADVVISVFQIILFGLCFGIQTSNGAVLTIVIVVVHCASVLVGVVTYFLQWMRYRNVFTCKQFCSCASGEPYTKQK